MNSGQQNRTDQALLQMTGKETSLFPCWLYHQTSGIHTKSTGVENPLGKPDIELIIQADQITLAWNYIFMRQKPTQYVTLWAKCHFFVWPQLRFDPAAACHWSQCGGSELAPLRWEGNWVRSMLKFTLEKRDFFKRQTLGSLPTAISLSPFSFA